MKGRERYGEEGEEGEKRRERVGMQGGERWKLLVEMKGIKEWRQWR